MRSDYCQVGFDLLCSIDKRDLVLKISSSISQVIGVFLILYSLNTKMHLLRGNGIVSHVKMKFVEWTKFFRPNNQIVKSSGISVQLTSAVSLNSWQNIDNMDVKSALLRLQEEILRHSKEISKLNSEHSVHKKTVDSEIKRIDSDINRLKIELQSLIDDLNVGGLTPQAWSLFLIVYSAFISVIV